MNQLRVARDQLLDVNDQMIGIPQTAKIDGKTIRCIIEEITSEEAAIGGGLMESGGFRLSCIPKESLSPVPDKGTEIQARNQDLELLSIIEYNDCSYTVTAGSLNRGES